MENTYTNPAPQRPERLSSDRQTSDFTTSTNDPSQNTELDAHPSPIEKESQKPSTSAIAKPKGKWPTTLALKLSIISSIGGFIFGYESGQISGFMLMSDFRLRFGENGVFSAARQGTIVGFLSIGTLVGCLFSGWICDKMGRRYTISASAFSYIVGVVIEITSDSNWVQFAMGRFAAGLGIGALSTSVPMYQSESVPKNIRGVVVSSYQLLITLGIWTACMVNYGTESKYDNSAQWRIPNGLSSLWAILLGTAILFLPESPRYSYRAGRKEEARKVLAQLSGEDPYGPEMDAEINEIERKLQADNNSGSYHWHEIFTAPRMLYRTLLGCMLQAGQQMTGVNFFFYYGTTIFRSTGIDNSYITAIILGTVNVVATIGGLWLIQNVGRRKMLICGAAWICLMFLVYAFVGTYALDSANPMNTPVAGTILIVVTCLVIVAFAITWGPLVWTIVSELYPTQYRAPCVALATSSNWLFNFLISFFTTFVTDKIHYWYGMVFAGACAALCVLVYFFVVESKDRTLEEIDTMYLLHVNPITSAKWTAKDLVVDENGLRTDGAVIGAGGEVMGNVQAEKSELVHSHY